MGEDFNELDFDELSPEEKDEHVSLILMFAYPMLDEGGRRIAHTLLARFGAIRLPMLKKNLWALLQSKQEEFKTLTRDDLLTALFFMFTMNKSREPVTLVPWGVDLTELWETDEGMRKLRGLDE